jgi:hypothetical protein
MLRCGLLTRVQAVLILLLFPKATPGEIPSASSFSAFDGIAVDKPQWLATD